MNSLEEFLSQITTSLKNELACDCFYEYKSTKDYKTDPILELHLPILMMEMGLKLDDIIRENYFICTIAIEIDDDDNIVSQNHEIRLNDWDVENLLEEKLNTEVTSVGAIIKEGKRFRT